MSFSLFNCFGGYFKFITKPKNAQYIGLLISIIIIF